MVEAEVQGMIRAAESQGLVSRAEALRFLSKRQLRSRLETGAWVRVFPSIFRHAGAPVSWRQSVEALLLWAGTKAALSHKTAAALHGFEGFEEGPLEVTTTLRTVFDHALREKKTTLEDLKRVANSAIGRESSTSGDSCASSAATGARPRASSRTSRWN